MRSRSTSHFLELGKKMETNFFPSLGELEKNGYCDSQLLTFLVKVVTPNTVGRTIHSNPFKKKSKDSGVSFNKVTSKRHSDASSAFFLSSSFLRASSCLPQVLSIRSSGSGRSLSPRPWPSSLASIGEELSGGCCCRERSCFFRSGTSCAAAGADGLAMTLGGDLWTSSTKRTLPALLL